MIDFLRRPQGRMTGVLVLVIVAATLGASGCGSSGDSPSSGTASRSSTDGAVDTEAAAAGAANAPAVAAKPSPAAGKTSKGSPAQSSPTSPAGDRGDDLRPSADRAPTANRFASRCPAVLTRAQCRHLGKDLSKTSHSHAVNKPQDCLEVMSRAECKTTYAEQQAATEDADTALSVKECVRNPTPRCEAQFKPILEAFAASQEAGS